MKKPYSDQWRTKMNFNLVKVDGILTMESISQRLEIDRDDFYELSRVYPREDELEYYQSISNEISKEYQILTASQKKDTNRRFIIQNNECISMIHFLFGRHINCMSVYLRSSSSEKLPSDLGFLARTAIKYDVHKIVINFGSFHVNIIQTEDLYK